MQSTASAPHRSRRDAAVRDWVDTLSGIDLQAAQQVQRALDDRHTPLGLPVGEARELAADDLMPMERAALFAGTPWADTLPAELAP